MTIPRTPTLLLAARLDPLRDPDVLQAVYAEASPERRQKVDRLQNEADRRRSLGAERLLRLALRRIDAEPDELAFTYGAAGKPFLRHPDNVCFSLSHSGDYVLCAVSDGEIGCDIQKITDVRLALAKRFFAAEEFDAVAAQPTESAQADLFFRYWTLKESFLKARGCGLSVPLSSFCIRFGDDGIFVEPPADGKRYRGKDFDDIPGYRCAVCLPRDVGDVRLQQVSLM